ncbi:MAG: cyclic nucleotide-binding domain-containing protein [Nitrospirota bacterium]
MLNENSLWGNIFKSKIKEDAAVINILRKIPVFDDLNRRELAAIERILHRREYNHDEIIFREGDPGAGMYIIETGRVDIVREPDMHVLAELNDGEFFGELALLDDSPRTATAIVKIPCKMLCFLQPDMLDMIERNPRLGTKVLLRLARTMGERLKKSNEQIQALKEELSIKT